MNKLVSYAGSDGSRNKFSMYSKPRLSQRADELFRFGNSTKQVAAIMKVTEARAVRMVSIGRSKRLGLPSPYSSSEAT